MRDYCTYECIEIASDVYRIIESGEDAVDIQYFFDTAKSSQTYYKYYYRIRSLGKHDCRRDFASVTEEFIPVDTPWIQQTIKNMLLELRFDDKRQIVMSALYHYVIGILVGIKIHKENTDLVDKATHISTTNAKVGWYD